MDTATTNETKKILAIVKAAIENGTSYVDMLAEMKAACPELEENSGLAGYATHFADNSQHFDCFESKGAAIYSCIKYIIEDEYFDADEYVAADDEFTYYEYEEGYHVSPSHCGDDGLYCVLSDLLDTEGWYLYAVSLQANEG